MRLALITAAAVLALAVGPVTTACAQPGTVQAQRPLLATEVVPPTGGAAAAGAPAVDDGVSVRRTLEENGGDLPRTLTLDFAALDPIDTGTTITTARGPIGQFLDMISYWFTSLITTINSDLTPPSPESFAKAVKSKDVNNLWRLVSDAGYKLKEISTDVGVVPDVSFKFGYVRELSDGDVNWLERKLARHARIYKDPISIIQRMIIYTLLNVNSSDTYFVSQLQVKLLPLPKAQFTLQPWDSGLSPEHDALLHAIQGRPLSRHKAVEEDSRY